jgi:rhodanese-related sulfurtransferase
MTVKTISPLEAQRLIDAGGVLVDIRQPHETYHEKIEGAIAMPLTSFETADLGQARGRKVVFFCQSGGRTRMFAGQIEAKAAGVCDPNVMSGGILAWRKAGLPTVAGPRLPGLQGEVFDR